jgi:hypothetical protein
MNNKPVSGKFLSCYLVMNIDARFSAKFDILIICVVTAHIKVGDKIGGNLRAMTLIQIIEIEERNIDYLPEY